MRTFTELTALVAPLDQANIDTDVILPKQFLRSIKKTGFGAHCFDEWRYLDRGELGQDPASRQLNPDFVLNQARYQGAGILLTRNNFGCGSSREHAPWALLQYGFRALIAPSFADIFQENCYKNGLLPVILPESSVDQLFQAVMKEEGYTLTISLVEQTVMTPLGCYEHFSINQHYKYCLLHGLDDIALSLQKKDAITLFEQQRKKHFGWLNQHD